jgi:alpha-tubulin suppressor-like RCC1 family protein
MTRIVLVALLVACGSHHPGKGDDDDKRDDAATVDDKPGEPDAPEDPRPDAGIDSGTTPDGPPVDPGAASELVAGGGHMCSIKGTTLSCWGLNDLGQLGVASTVTCGGQPCTKTPVQVLTQVTRVALGQRATCALREDKTLWCFGDGRQRQLGMTPTGSCSGNAACVPTPTQVPNLTQVIDVAVGTTHSCAVVQSGAVLCTGNNSVGELGNGTTAQSNTFVPVSGISTAIGVRVGQNFSCALLADHTVSCWGHNLIGQLGRGNLNCTTCTTPSTIAGLSHVKQLSLGAAHACAVRDDLGVWCWGSNQIGQSAVGPEVCTGVSCSMVPRQIANHVAFEVRTGFQHTCSRNLDGTTSCWGSDFAGQLGIQPFPTDCSGIHPCAKSPRLVTGTLDNRRLALGDGFSCALVANGSGQCWGNNAMAQFGDGSTLEALTPVAVTTW